MKKLVCISLLTMIAAYLNAQSCMQMNFANENYCLLNTSMLEAKASSIKVFTVNGIKYRVVGNISDRNVEVASTCYNDTTYADSETQVWQEVSGYEGSIHVPSTVQYNDITFNIIGLGDSAFFHGFYLDSVFLSEGITYIKDRAFTENRARNCVKTLYVSLPNSLKTIGINAFKDCFIYDLVIPDNVDSIGSGCFWNMYSHKVTLGKSVKFMGNLVIENISVQNKYIDTLVCRSKTPPTVKYNWFPGFPKFKTLLIVPCAEDINVYQSSSKFWKNFKSCQAAGECDSDFNPDLPTNPSYNTISIKSVPENACSVSGCGSYLPNETISITVSAKEGYTFNKWEDGLQDTVRDIVVPSFDTIYTVYFIPKKYKITFKNFDSTILYTDSFDYNTYPEYIGNIPTKQSSKRYNYVFKEWKTINGNLYARVSGNEVYIATYDSISKCQEDVIIKDYVNTSDTLICETSNIIIKHGGYLNLDEQITAKSLTLYYNNVNNAQIGHIENLSVENAYMIMQFNSNGNDVESGKWYSLTVPFKVNISSGISKYGEVTETIYGKQFVIIQYNESQVNSNQVGWETYNGMSLYPGKFYMISFPGKHNTWKFTAENPDSLYCSNEVSVSIDYSPNKHSWSSLANPIAENAKADTSIVKYAITYDNNYRTYKTISLEEDSLISNQHLFIQVAQTCNILFEPKNTSLMAPLRNSNNDSESLTYSIKLKDSNNYYEDNAFLTLSNDKEDEFEVGKDMVKMLNTNSDVQQIWINAYYEKLSVYEANMNSTSFISLGLYVKTAGTYILSIENGSDDLIFKLYHINDFIIASSKNEWEVDLNEGNNDGYKFVIERRNVATDLKDINTTDKQYKKAFINGTIYIINDNHLYDIVGHKL